MKEHYAPDFLAGAPRRSGLRKGFAAALRQRIGFTLTEVVLAVGVLSLSIVALVGLFGPTMGAVKNVVDRSGALAVADHLNSQLLSGEIYQVFGVENAADPFLQLSGKLLDAGATEVPDEEGVVYAWREYANAGNRGQADDVSLQLSITRPASGVLPRIEGAVYFAVLEEGLQQSSNKYDFGQVANSAYFPIQVSIYEAPMSDLVNNSDPDFEEFLKGERGKPLFQYTTAKLR